MRKAFLLSIGVFVFSACSDEATLSESILDDSPTVESSVPRLRSLDEVAEMANSAATKFKKSQSRAATPFNLEINCITSSSSSRSVADTLLYVVNYGDNNGFAIISAKTDHEGILAVTESGTYTPGEDFENPGMSMMMDNAIAYASSLGDIVTLPTVENPQMMDWVSDTTAIDVEPRLKVAWGTDYLGESGSPDDNVTCGPIAVAQALSYLKQPSSIILTHADNEEISLDWESMISDANLINYQRNSLGIEIAYRMGTFTSENHSSTIADCEDVINQLVSGHTTSPVNYAPSLNTIKDSGILIVSGTKTDELKSDGSNGHTFIIDGGHVLIITETTYIVTYLYGTTTVLSREFKGTETLCNEYYFHINWGWSGINNGYFNRRLLAPHYGIKYDSDRVVTSDGSYDGNYQYNQWYMVVK